MLADVAIALFLAGCVLVGFFRGALRQLIVLGAWLLSFLVAAQGRPFLADWLLGQEPDFSDQYALMLSLLLGFVILFGAALVILELSGRTVTLTSRPMVEELVGAAVMLAVGVLTLTALLIALGTYYSAEPRSISAEVSLVRQLNTALADSAIARALHDTLVPGIQALLGPLLPPDVRSFGGG